jgi:hypothetical protein
MIDEGFNVVKPVLSSYLTETDLEVGSPDLLIALIAKKDKRSVRKAEARFRRLTCNGLDGLVPGAKDLITAWADPRMWETFRAPSPVADVHPVTSEKPPVGGQPAGEINEDTCGNFPHATHDTHDTHDTHATQKLSNSETRVTQILKTLLALVPKNACLAKGDPAWRRLWNLAREVKAIELNINRRLDTKELTLVFDEWYRLSKPNLDPEKNKGDFFSMFLAYTESVKVPTGGGRTDRALKIVAELSASELVAIEDMPDAEETWRRILTMHREMARQHDGGHYPLGSRDCGKAARPDKPLSHEQAAFVNRAFVRLGKIKEIQKGVQKPGSRNATTWEYLLPIEPLPARLTEDEKEIKL